MAAVRLGRLPVFWQTLLLLLAALVVAQMVGFLLLFVAPPPRPDFNRLSDIAATLAGHPLDERGHDEEQRERRLLLSRTGASPTAGGEMVAERQFTRALAARLGRPERDVRLFFAPDRGDRFSNPHRRPSVVNRDGDPLFFTALVAAVAEPGGGWRVAATPSPPLLAPWQRRQLLWFAVSALALAPLAWVFARALTQPIRRFADAADRLGADPQAPPIAEEGPAELRTTARALNGMQARLAGYVGERTAMVAAIAHDLRTPLARIAFRIEAAPEPLRDKVVADVEQMRAMLSATIGFARTVGASGPRARVDLAALLAAIAEQDRDLGRPVAFSRAAPAEVSGDPLALERLVQNLIDNGIAYAGAVELSLAHEGGRAAVTVADRGPGLPAELLARVFQPFVRGDPSRNRATGGIGLGLSIARTIAEDHGGTLTLANRTGGGLEARLTLPLAA